jgi:hypothetical protein
MCQGSEQTKATSQAEVLAQTEGKPILLSTYHWHEPWFSACCGLDMSKFDIFELEDRSADDFDIERHVSELCAKIKSQGGQMPAITSGTDSMMICHAMVKESLRASSEPRFAEMKGASLCATVLCDHKLLTRALVPACGSVKCGYVCSTDAVIPAIDGLPADADMILKPVAALGSVNIHKVKAGQHSPFHGLQAETAGALHKATFLHVEKFGANVPGASECIGLLEEYIAPSVRKVSVDGAYVKGAAIPWAISDNVYHKDQPEVFEALETPSNRTSPEEQDRIWEVFTEICDGLHRLSDGDFDCQFVCVEMFVFDSSRVEVMEVNIRASANQLPTFHKVMDGGCPFAAHVIMQGPNPESLVRPTSNGTFACTLYRDTLTHVPSGTATDPQKDDFEAIYYCRNSVNAQVYGYGNSPAEARSAAETLYARCVAASQAAAELGTAGLEDENESEHILDSKVASLVPGTIKWGNCGA